MTMSAEARIAGLLADLADEHTDLERVVDGLDEATWRIATPADGWTIADQISHLAFFDRRAALAIADPDAFARDRDELIRAAPHDRSVDLGRTVTPSRLLGEWRAARAELVTVASGVRPDVRIPWYGPAMAPTSFLTARLMETWAHGQDVVDALGANRAPTARLRHVAHIGVGARAYALSVNARPADTRPVDVELTAPTGETWTWRSGDPAADSSSDAVAGKVSGPALDFCLVATQRRHLDDTALVVTGDAATTWMAVVQAFAGPAGRGRPPRRDG